MKYAICAAVALVSSLALADGFVSGESFYYLLNQGGKLQSQVSVTGKSAEALYASLKVKEGDILEEHSGIAIGSYKNGDDISCSQTYGSYSCTIFVDEAGKLVH